METMIDSGIEWIGDIPKSWEINRIKYIAQLKGRIGWQGLTSEEYLEEGPYLITGVDFCEGGIDWDNCYHIPLNRWEEAKDIQIENGDLLITKDGTIGKVAIVSEMPDKTSLNSGVLRIITNDKCDRKFLYWVLQSDLFWNWFNYKNAGSSTIQHLYQADFAEFKYAFPTIDEQKKIADYLDKECSKLDSVIEDTKKQIDLLKKYKKSLITEVITKGLDEKVELKDSKIDWIGEIPASWKTSRIKYVLSGIKDGTHATIDREDSGRRLLSAKNVFFDGIHIGDNESLISESDYKTIVASGYPKKGDVLFTCVGTIGRTCVYNLEEPEAFQRSVIFMRTNELIHPEYLCFALQTSFIESQEKILVNKTAQDGLYIGNVREMVICYPSDLKEQERIQKFLSKKCKTIDDTICLKELEVNNLEKQKKSIIYKSVTGKNKIS